MYNANTFYLKRTDRRDSMKIGSLIVVLFMILLAGTSGYGFLWMVNHHIGWWALAILPVAVLGRDALKVISSQITYPPWMAKW
jgi:hypothetical protein